MGDNEEVYIKQAFESNWIAPVGPNLDGFESDIATYNNVDHCVAVSSGTAALHLALMVLGIKSGDEVLCSTFTFSATVNAIRYLDAIPVFIDSDRDTWNMCPKLLKSTINERLSLNKKPKVCLVVHLYGMPTNMLDIKEICQESGIPIIEDAAEALGAEYMNKKMGTYGDIGIFSFNGNKIITTSGGGALISSNKEYVDKARFLATQAREPKPFYQHEIVGYNYRLSNVSAGIGRGQMEVLDERVRARREINKWYREILSEFSFIKFHSEPSSKFYSNYWLTAITFQNSNLCVDSIRLKLEEENIESRHLWKPMHLQPVFCGFPSYLNETSESLFKTGLCLPSGSNINDNQKDRLSKALITIFRTLE